MLICQHRGGQVLKNYGEYSCLQCSREHDSKGRLLRRNNGKGRKRLYSYCVSPYLSYHKHKVGEVLTLSL